MLPDPFVPHPADLELLDRVSRSVARARGLSTEDAEDFAQSVHVRVAERRYDVFRRFEGRASLRTYLTVVVARLLKDWQNHEYGKWRPSAAARRLGALGAALDQELNREGWTEQEAVSVVATRTGQPERLVRHIAAALPRRSRKRLVRLEAAEDRAVAFDDPIAAADRVRIASHARSVLRDVLTGMPRPEKILLLQRYVQMTPVSALASQAGVEPKKLYRDFDRLRRTLRTMIEARGVRCAVPAD